MVVKEVEEDGLLEEEVVVKEVVVDGLQVEEEEEEKEEVAVGLQVEEVEDGQVVAVAAVGMMVEQLKIGGERYLLNFIFPFHY